MATSVTRERHWLPVLFGITQIAPQVAIASLVQTAMTARLVLKLPVLTAFIHLRKTLHATFVLPDINVQLCPANRLYVQGAPTLLAKLVHALHAPLIITQRKVTLSVRQFLQVLK
jgi:hypothetical protein